MSPATRRTENKEQKNNDCFSIGRTVNIEEGRLFFTEKAVQSGET
jgi:hypothetical protein